MTMTTNNQQQTTNNKPDSNLVVSRKLSVVSNRRGFTLLETLVSVFILTLTIVGPMSIASSTLFNATVAREQVTAFYLAQEAIEGVRSVRDGNGLANPQNPWLQDITVGTDFTIDVVNPTSGRPTISTSNCSDGDCDPIKYDSTTHLYQHSTGSETNFKRIVRLESISPNEVSISVTVKWNVGKIERTFTARENIFNWQ